MMIDRSTSATLDRIFDEMYNLILRLTVYLLLIRSLSKRAIWRVSWMI
jgi:hypothetical protein